MAPEKKLNSRVKNPEQYEALRDKGYSKEKSARIANTEDSGYRGGKASKYEERTKQDLYEQAKKVGISGRSAMNKQELIEALRNN
ncbi:Rho termination factor [Flavobacterium salilacus subsp. salilacus]|uniref:Rho termination factor N-terminal domain-containing protein n=1 Tax=Flavobacterium TaxID=237 RepID=UPI001074B14E|nr:MULTISPECIES: Rho termination factor N-terminal domain-containing protein [Flavobacterium]KAF2519436.1 Rho termination factor [Flavobacterium salilacus subsp. salilacus]MBE1614672.1 Rho termination factor N-terminal domain-containing protein [Flavobacterium sp. SaA2.13]